MTIIAAAITAITNCYSLDTLSCNFCIKEISLSSLLFTKLHFPFSLSSFIGVSSVMISSKVKGDTISITFSILLYIRQDINDIKHLPCILK